MRKWLIHCGSSSSAALAWRVCLLFALSLTSVSQYSVIPSPTRTFAWCRYVDRRSSVSRVGGASVLAGSLHRGLADSAHRLPAADWNPALAAGQRAAGVTVKPREMGRWDTDTVLPFIQTTLFFSSSFFHRHSKRIYSNTNEYDHAWIKKKKKNNDGLRIWLKYELLPLLSFVYVAQFLISLLLPHVYTSTCDRWRVPKTASFHSACAPVLYLE